MGLVCYCYTTPQPNREGSNLCAPGFNRVLYQLSYSSLPRCFMQGTTRKADALYLTSH